MMSIRAMRAAQVAQDKRHVPAGQARLQSFRSTLKARQSGSGSDSRIIFEGYASAFEMPYEMYDFWGPYTEIVSVGAADATLAAEPDTAFLTNHRGVTMARTTSGTLQLSADSTGLADVASTNAARQDVQILRHAVDDGDVTEQSFAFMITAGQWSPDYTEYRINAFDINRGDVSAVNYGANPYTSVAARSHELLSALEHLPAGAAREAMRRLRELGVVEEDEATGRAVVVRAPELVAPTGRGVSYMAALLDLDA